MSVHSSPHAQRGFAIAMLDFASAWRVAEPSDPKGSMAGTCETRFSRGGRLWMAQVLAIEMPGRAEDAAIVPLTVRATLAPTDSRRVNPTRS